MAFYKDPSKFVEGFFSFIREEQMIEEDATIKFVGEKERIRKEGIVGRHNGGQLRAGRDWQLEVDIGKQLVIPRQIGLRPDIVLWSESQKTVFFCGADSAMGRCSG